MRKFFHFSVAALLALSLVLVAGHAFAQDMMDGVKITGYAEAGFGQFTPGGGDAEFTSGWDTQVMFKAKSGPVSGEIRYRNRPRGDTIYREAAWKPADALTVAFGNMTIPESSPIEHRNGLDTQKTGLSGGALGDNHTTAHNVLITGVPKLGVYYNLGVATVGLHILTQACRPGCGAADSAQSTNVITARGAFGPLQFRVMSASASGEDAGGTSYSGSSTLIGLKYTLGDMAFYLSSGSADNDGATKATTTLAFDGFNVFFQYSTSDADQTAMRLQYYIKPGKGMTVYPEYVSYTPDADSDPDTIIRLVAKKAF